MRIQLAIHLYEFRRVIFFGIRPNFCESEKVTVVSEWNNLPWLYNAFQVGKL